MTHASVRAPSRDRFLRIGEVIVETGLSRTTIWRLELKGDFPNRVKLSANSMGWWSADIDRWVEERRNAEPG